MCKRALGLLALCIGMLTGCQADPAFTPTPSATRPVTLHFVPTATRPPQVPALLSAVSTPTTSQTPSPTQPVALPSLTPYPASYPVATPTPIATATRRPTPLPTITPTRAHPVYSGPPLDRSEVGIQVHLHQEDVGRIFEHLRALNVGWVKVQVSWKLYEPEPGRYDQERLLELDHLVSNATSSDIYLLLGVAKAPEWSRPTTEMDGPPIDYAQFGDFMSFLAGRYRRTVAAYELWNEPNLRREWNGSPLNAADLVKLIRLGAAAVRAADPLAIVVSGAPAATGINDRVTAIDDRVYLREMLAAGVADVVDAIGAHPYGWANPPDSSAAAPDPAAPSHNDHPSFFYRDTLWDYFTILREAGRSEMQVWVTEFGWGSFEGLDATPPADAEYMSAVSEWQQATYTLRAFELAHTWRWVGPLFLWNLNFAPLLGTDFGESGYSLLRPDGSPRPVYLALQTMPKEY